MSAFHTLGRLLARRIITTSATSLGSLGIFRENQDAIDVIGRHFTGCRSLADCFLRWLQMDGAARMGIMVYAGIIMATLLTLARGAITVYQWCGQEAARPTRKSSRNHSQAARPRKTRRPF